VVKVYLEHGTTRVFAGALDWPGWSRSGRNEVSALQALLDYGARYADVLKGSGLQFRVPGKLSDLKVVERLKGGAGTNAGWPQAYPLADAAALDEAELQRAGEIFRACWQQFDTAVKEAEGKVLRKDSNGRGRDLESTLRHVLQGHSLYLSELGAEPPLRADSSPRTRLRAIRPFTLQVLRKAAKGSQPGARNRGGRGWSPRYFVRRAAWHILDHAWEIEDRIE
jgi:hypothetical protein